MRLWCSALGLAILVLGATAPSPGAGTETGGGPIVPIGMVASLWGPTEDMIGVREGLADLGFRQNQEVALGVRAAGGREEGLDDLVRQLLGDGAKILYASDWPALEAARRVAAGTPIVFAAWHRSARWPPLDRLGDNVTGVLPASPEVGPESLELLRAFLPALGGVLVPYAADEPAEVRSLPALRAAAARLGLDLAERPVRSREAAREAILGARGVDAILPVGGRWNIAGYALQASLQRRVPALFTRGWLAEYGGLASYGPSWRGLGRRAAHLLAAILRGSDPADLPVEFTERRELVINLRAARALGVAVPPHLLARADRVIE